MFTHRSNFWKCDCSKFVTHVAKPGCSSDDAAVASLPDHWTPKRSGQLLFKYLQKRSLDYDHLIQDLQDEAKTFNNYIDGKVSFIFGNLQAHIEDNRRQIYCVVAKYDTETLPLPKGKKNEALEKIGILIQERRDNILTFKVEALEIEKERGEGIKKILRDKFHRLIKLGGKPLKELLHDFDSRIYDINQQLISNKRSYLELEEQLNTEGKDDAVRAKSLLNQLSLGVPLHIKSEVFEIHTKQEVTAEDIKQCIATLIEQYETEISKLLTEFSNHIIDMYKDFTYNDLMVFNDTTSKVNELQNCIDKSVKSLTNKVNAQPCYLDIIELTSTNVDEMQISVSVLGERLRETYSMLQDAGHLFDAHILRVGLAQKFALTAVEDLVTNNDMAQLSYEVPFNIALEQMRSSSDTMKMQQICESAIAMLTSIGEMYAKHRDLELAKLEEYNNLPNSLAAMLTAEFESFVLKHPRSHHIPGSGSATNQTLSLNPEDFTPVQQATFQTELHCLVLMNWRNEFLEFFENTFKSIPEWLMQQSRLWIDDKASSLHKRYATKMLSHNVRLERVKVARDARLAEIRQHDNRLTSHLRAIADFTEKLSNEALNYLPLDSSKLYPLCKWAADIQKRIDDLLSQDPVNPEVKKLKMSSYEPRLVKYRQLFEESVEKVISDYKAEIARRVNEVRKCNVDFLASVRMLSEGGRYSSAEAMKTTAALVKGGEAIETCLMKSLEAATQRRIQLISLATQRLAPIQRIVEETVKSGPKGKDAKKPPTVVGKKKK